MVTYNLAGQHPNSDLYYHEIHLFTQKVLDRGKERVSDLVVGFQTYLIKDHPCIDQGAEQLSMGEGILELLTLGVLWNEYAYCGQVFFPPYSILFQGLIGLRSRGSHVKTIADGIRGRLTTLLLYQPPHKNSTVKANEENFKRLLAWLAATNEFNQEVRILQRWRAYFLTLPLSQMEIGLKNVFKLAHWFQKESEAVLGQYTVNVDSFLEGSYAKHMYKENLIFCSRRRIEYHLNMVGAEVMNGDLREDFFKTTEKRLLLPVCMRFKGEKACQAKQAENGMLCSHCSVQCQISQMTKMGEDHDFQVLIIPHGSSVFSAEDNQKGQVGIVGVACVLNLLAGGWQAKSLKFVPQCVVLEGCGCEKHWCQCETVTSISFNQLKQVLNLDAESIKGHIF